MTTPNHPPSSTPAEHYVDAALGLRVFFFAVALSCVAGLSLRLYFHPARVKGLVEQAVGSEAGRIGLKFQTAKLSFAQGAIPHLAVEVAGIELNPAHICRSEPSVRIAKLFLPLNLAQLLRFKLAFGTIASEDIEVDLDALKQSCATKSSAAGRGVPTRSVAAEPAPNNGVAGGAGAVTPWWTAGQVVALQERVEGFDFSRVTVFFEEATKKVYLESFSLEPGPSGGSLRLATKLVIPPKLTYDERLPVLRIEALAGPTSADVSLRTNFNEGSLSVEGKLLAAAGGYLDADLQARVAEVPLSTVVPLLAKSGVVKGEFHPRFMWMNCQAAIRGRFQGLFVENPLKLSDCEIVGKGAKIKISEAVRKADGSWQPFVVALSNLDLAQIMDTFNWHGLDGVFSDYGRFDGSIKIDGRDDLELDGDLKNARVHFLSRNENADQLVQRLHARIETRSGRVSGLIDKIELENGHFEGQLAFEASDRGREGSIRADVNSLRLSESVQRVLTAGRFEDFSGIFSGRFVERTMVQGAGRFQVRGLSGKDLRLSKAIIKVDSAERGGELHLQVKAPNVEIRKDSRFFRGMAAIFFSHEFAGEWIKLDEPKLNAKVLTSVNAEFDNDSVYWLRWDAAQATLENRRIRLTSTGGMSRDFSIGGWVSADYPSLRALRWQFKGQFDKPELQADSRSLLDLNSKGAIDDARLGLLAKKSTRE